MTLSGDGNSTMTVRVGTTTFRATYLGRLSRMIPTERYLFLSPRATSGYTLERHFVARDVAKRGPPCLTRFASQAIGADAEIARAAAKVCAPFEPDCADHVVVELATTGRNFDDVARVLAAALRVPSLALRQWRFVEAGQASYPDAVTCAPDAGAK